MLRLRHVGIILLRYIFLSLISPTHLQYQRGKTLSPMCPIENEAVHQRSLAVCDEVSLVPHSPFLSFSQTYWISSHPCETSGGEKVNPTNATMNEAAKDKSQTTRRAEVDPFLKSTISYHSRHHYVRRCSSPHPHTRSLNYE